MPNILLIGYRGTGKTTLGRLLAEQLGWAFVDADDEIERAAGKSIAEIFADGGEPAFRDLEERVVAELTQRQQHVISLGGGAILREANRAAIRQGGTVFWLTASPETIHVRLAGDATTAQRRPNLTQQGGLAEIRQLLDARRPFYEQCADRTIETESRSLDEICAELIQHLQHD